MLLALADLLTSCWGGREHAHIFWVQPGDPWGRGQQCWAKPKGTVPCALLSYSPFVNVKANNIRTGRACRDTSPLQQPLLYGTLDSEFLPLHLIDLHNPFFFVFVLLLFHCFCDPGCIWHWMSLFSYTVGKKEKKKTTHISFAHFKSVNFIGHPLVHMQWEARHPFICFLGTFPGFFWFYTYLPYPPSLSLFQAESSKSI